MTYFPAYFIDFYAVFHHLWKKRASRAVWNAYRQLGDDPLAMAAHILTRDVGKHVAELVQSITSQSQPADRIIIALDNKDVVARAKFHEWSTRRHVVNRQRQEFEEISQRIKGTLESNRGKQACKEVAVIRVTSLMSVYRGSTKGRTARRQSSVSSCT